ncbi:cysteine hydrolase [Epibacterium ulvae]|uniref:cysteine hydrolase n=1 Tax=Epibacterium ulvae TaxID=1156985 RepID=UPI0024936C9D|nr:cysteine hydrolase [Epibacterium ulvae]
MANPNQVRRDLIEGNAALLVIDIQAGIFIGADDEQRSIDHMPGHTDRLRKARIAIDKARESDIPVIFIQEIHRANLVDFGRELDGEEDVHCLDNTPNTGIARAETGFRDDDYLIQKRRYSAFYGTDLEILLKGLKVETLLMVGGLTNVCVHYTFADGHQGDYFCRTIEDCVAASSTQAHDAALAQMEYLQAGGVRSLSETLEAMDAYAAKRAV